MLLFEKDFPNMAADRYEQNDQFFRKLFDDPDIMKQDVYKRQATGIAIRPVKGAISEGNRIRKKIRTSKLQKEVAGKRIRKKASNKGKELAKKPAKNASKNVTKKTSKKVAKDTTKEVTREGTKLAVKTGTTVAGSAAGPEGTLIGIDVYKRQGNQLRLSKQQNKY